MPVIRCPKCRQELDISADWLGASVQCHECGTEFVASAPVRASARPVPTARPRSADRDDDRPSRRRPLRDDDEDDDRPSRRRRSVEDDDRPSRRSRTRTRTKSGTGGVNTILIVLGILTLMSFAVCGGGGYWLVSRMSRPMEFAATDWHEHKLPDGGASVLTPVPLTPDFFDDGQGDVTVHKDLWESPGFDDVAFAFGVLDCPSDNPSTLDTIYQAEKTEILDTVDGKLVTERYLTVHGHVAREFEYNADGAIGVYRIVFIQEPRRKRFLLILAGGRNLSAPDRTKFIESVKIPIKK